jgi:hypothetical protein
VTTAMAFSRARPNVLVEHVLAQLAPRARVARA